MRDLVQKLPSSSAGNAKNQQQQPHDMNSASDETIAAVLATLNEVIKKNAEFARSLLDEGGVERLVSITRQKQRYSSRVVKFASQVLAALWTHQELRDAYKKSGWKVWISFFPSVELCIMFHFHFRRNRISSAGATVLCLEAAAVVVGCQAEAVLRLLVTRLPIRR